MKVVRSVLGKIAIVEYFFELCIERYDFLIGEHRVFDEKSSKRNAARFGMRVEEAERRFLVATREFLVKCGV